MLPWQAPILALSVLMTPPAPLVVTPPRLIVEDPSDLNHPDPAVDAVLDRLAASGADLHGFTAKVYYLKTNAFLAEKQRRTGTVLYAVSDDGQKQFAVQFDLRGILLPNGAWRTEKVEKRWIFDGRWLAEVEENQFIRRELVPPGETLDALRLGEGPIPIPLGQPKDEVMAHFEVALVEAPTEGPLAKLAETFSLTCVELTPHEKSPMADDYRKVLLCYDDETLLPVGVEAIEPNDDSIHVRLREPVRNPSFTDEQRAMLSTEVPEEDGWRVTVTPWTKR